MSGYFLDETGCLAEQDAPRDIGASAPKFSVDEVCDSSEEKPWRYDAYYEVANGEGRGARVFQVGCRRLWGTML